MAKRTYRSKGKSLRKGGKRRRTARRRTARRSRR